MLEATAVGNMEPAMFQTNLTRFSQFMSASMAFLIAGGIFWAKKTRTKDTVHGSDWQMLSGLGTPLILFSTIVHRQVT